VPGKSLYRSPSANSQTLK